ncbi:MAG TPA: sulfatase [Blastocatellia bacterium]|nr:sulfatase [Blastocatellia bacterium]HMX24962.1 sulfatase [Blastocatellia bacterium]HMY72209.1 sulfatase [Blastocatellia bacterium]
MEFSLLKTISRLILLLLLMTAGGLAQSRQRPNIVLVLADDLGWKDVGYQGSDFYETPNLDRLAKAGMVFTQAYAGAGNCAPSRAVLLSGQYGPRHGVYAVDNTKRGPVNLMRMEPIPNRSGLAPAQVTLAEALKAAGYATGIFGKWHLGGPEGALPKEQGFDVVYDSRPNPNQRRDEPEDPKGIYSLTRAATAFIEHNKDKPFFAYVAHHAIHTALEARPSSLAKFKAKQPGAQHKAALYAACLYDLDDGVGVLLNKLKELGLDQNTLFIFTSDNGGTQQSSQEPLRGNKGCYYEGGIREPFIAYWPGVINAGTTDKTPVHNVDLYPTFLATAAAKIPAGKTLDGESLLPLFKGNGKLKRQAIFWHFPGYLDDPVLRGRDPVFRTRPVSVIRKGDWKLHLYHEEWQLDGGRYRLATNNAVELYNIAADIGERNNLAQTNRAKRDELLGDLLQWIKTVNAPLPSERNPAYSSPDK